MRQTPLLSIAISRGKYAEFVSVITTMATHKTSAYVCVANVHMLVEAHQNKTFQAVVKNADIITPDGKPLVWALKLLYDTAQDRVAGMDILPDLLSNAATPVFFYGGTSQMLETTRLFIQRNYPNVQIAGMISPPFRPQTPEEELHTIQEINASGAGLVFVVLGCPKQEKWMAAMKNKINATMIGVGGALPVLIGLQRRAPEWMQHYGLEWLYRLGQEPRRLFKRYAVTNSIFLWLLLKAYLKRKKNAAA